jgi:hypothetical protein
MGISLIISLPIFTRLYIKTGKIPSMIEGVGIDTDGMGEDARHIASLWSVAANDGFIRHMRF